MDTKLKIIAAGCVLILLGCDSKDSSDDPEPTPAAPARGSLQAPPELVDTVPAAAFLLQLGALADQRLLTLGGTPVCDLAIYRVRYHTVDAKNEPATASTALMIPTGANAECRGDRPILLYAHGTSTERSYNLMDLDGAEALLMAAFFGAQGYIVVAPNYLGYDTTSYIRHPYLIADQQSKDMIDALRAARTALPVASATLTRDNGKLFVTGYSQGGYVAMATHRAMQAAGMTVTASAPMSGPYAIAAFVDALFAGRVNSGAPVYSTLLITAYDYAYGDVYATPDEAFATPFSTGIETLLPADISRSQLYAQGKLPNATLFSSTPPAPQYADITPATTPSNLAPTFAAGFGTTPLLTNPFRLNYLQDAAAHPDGGWPTTTTGTVAANPSFGLRRALKTNDLREWTPSSPTLLCGGHDDPSVYWFNTQLVQSSWAARGFTATVLDVDGDAVANDPYEDIKEQFDAAKFLIAAMAVADGATDGGAAAVADAYHDQLVPAFCLVAVREFFDDLQ